MPWQDAGIQSTRMLECLITTVRQHLHAWVSQVNCSVVQGSRSILGEHHIRWGGGDDHVLKKKCCVITFIINFDGNFKGDPLGSPNKNSISNLSYNVWVGTSSEIPCFNTATICIGGGGARPRMMTLNWYAQRVHGWFHSGPVGYHCQCMECPWQQTASCVWWAIN